MTPHEQLPASYLASCEEFFKWLKDCRKNGFKAPSSKHQAPSFKLHGSRKKFAQPEVVIYNHHPQPPAKCK